MTKVELRQRLASELRAWISDRGRHHTASDVICREIQQQRTWREAKLICAFLPLPSEPQIAPMWALESGPPFCFPRVCDGDVELIRIENREHLARADWKLADPEFAAAPVVAPDAVDLFLVPGLAFSPDGRRLGRGGGYYDRLLAKRSRRSVAQGVCFSIQLVEALPIEAHDQHVDAVITERGVAPVV